MTTGFPTRDAYQMLAYCTALRLQRGYLVYAKDSGETSVTHQVRNTDIEVAVRTVDVEHEPDALLAAVARLAAEVADGGEGSRMAA